MSSTIQATAKGHPDATASHRAGRAPSSLARLATIAVVLPESEPRLSSCVAGVRDRLTGRTGVRSIEVDSDAGRAILRIAYDPRLVTLAGLERELNGANGVLDPNMAHVLLRVEGMRSVQSERSIERMLFGIPSLSANASYSSGNLRLEFDRRECPLPEVVRRLDKLGYRAVPSTADAPMSLSRARSLAARLGDGLHWATSHIELTLVLVGGALLLAGYLVGLASTATWDGWNVARIALLATSAVLTSTETGPGAWEFIRRFRLDVDVLMFAAAIGAASLGKFEEGALLLFLFGLGAAGEHLALSRARASIEALTKIAPETARVLTADGIERDVPVAEVGVGDLVRVNPFDRVPIDGVVEEGRSAIDQSPVTGESVPVEKYPGSEVFAGTVNAGGRLVVRCGKPAASSTLSRIIQLVEEAQSTKSSTQVFTDRVESYYVPTVFVATAVLIVALPFLAHVSWGIGFYRSMAFLTAASPCALAIGTPAALLCAIARSARIGVLIKGGVHLENLATIRAVALDKTGTLTTGKLSVTDVYAAASAPGTTPFEPADILRLAAAVEATSTHPLATAVVRHARAAGIVLPSTDEVHEIPATGIEGSVILATDDASRPRTTARVFAGKPSHVNGDEAFRVEVERLRSQGRAVVAVAIDGRAAGLIALADTPRPDARAALDELTSLGIRRCVMLTGDHRAAAEPVARSTGVDAFHADLLPEDKLRLLRELAADYGPVAMVGDGVNDAPALAQATVGIAIGGASGTASDVAMETADVVLLSDDLRRLPAAISLAQRAHRIIAQNLTLALGVICIVAPLSALGYTRLSVAVLLHEGSTVVVVLNSLRLLRAGKPPRVINPT